MIKTLAKSIREYKLPSILTLIFIMGEVIIEVLIPFITADLVNNIKAGVDINYVLKTGLLLILMALISLCCGGIAALTCAKASAGFAKNLRSDMFSKIQSYSFANIDKFSSTSLVTRLTTDITHVQMSYMMIIRTAIRSPMLFIFSVFMAYKMGGSLATSFVVVIPVLIFGLLMVSQKAMPAFRRVFKKYDKLNESIEENVRGMRVVKGFSREDYEKEKFGFAADGITNDFTKAERIVAINTPLMQFCMYFNSVVILFLGSYLVISSGGLKVDVGQISAMLTYGVQILMSLMMLSMIYVMITISLESMKRICEVLKEEPLLKNPESPEYEVKDGSVVFKNVSFKYSKDAKRYALEDINLEIKSGMTVGIIGGTGSSKSSLVQLIPRLYDVTEGSVEVGGIDVRNYDINTLRDSVAMVLQKNQLFSGTIKENLRWGKEDATDSEIIEVCRLAQADEFIESFPEKYDKYIEQGGTNVSGGQKQRLCIARALLKHPKILILDDSTSAVDTKTDAFIRKGFKEYIPETTKIIIAQRIASVEDADMIIVMNNGKIENVGNHKELLQNSEIYREVYEQQIGGGDEA
ncbi:MAG: ABC transporter ATP-binding protein [Clostridia bacterium]|nr:ABC transporter ATP-binding protein [Clostridia bacterium]MBR4972870.1 ABC transporter ATP-binding protein [Clostridia bacterium]